MRHNKISSLELGYVGNYDCDVISVAGLTFYLYITFQETR